MTAFPKLDPSSGVVKFASLGFRSDAFSWVGNGEDGPDCVGKGARDVREVFALLGGVVRFDEFTGELVSRVAVSVCAGENFASQVPKRISS